MTTDAARATAGLSATTVERASWMTMVATPDQMAEAIRINTEARLRALEMGLIILAGLAVLTVVPAGWLPNYLPGELPAEPGTR